jgi:hypothetical protein
MDVKVLQRIILALVSVFFVVDLDPDSLQSLREIDDERYELTTQFDSSLEGRTRYLFVVTVSP